MPASVITGEEPYIIDKMVAKIKEQIRFPEMNLSSFEQLDEEVRGIIKSIPMVDEKRVVILSFDEIKGSDSDELLKTVKGIPVTTEFVVVARSIDKRSAFYKFVKKEEKLQECNKLTETQLRRFAFDILEEKGSKITNSAYSLLVKHMNYFEDPEVSLYTVEVFIRQLMYLSTIITDYEVQKVVPESSNEKIYMLTKAMLSGNQEKTFSLALDFIEREENVIGVLSMMLRVFRLAYKASLYDDYNKAELGSLLGVPLYQFQDALSVRKESLNLVLDTIQIGINAIKSGKCDADNMFIIVLGKIFSVLNPFDKKESQAHY